jgi:ParE toxin of type II toxin-antitoxin system, parDE
MKVIIRESAEDDLDRIFEWIAKDNRSAAARMVAKIRDGSIYWKLIVWQRWGDPALSLALAS